MLKFIPFLEFTLLQCNLLQRERKKEKKREEEDHTSAISYKNKKPKIELKQRESLRRIPGYGEKPVTQRTIDQLEESQWSKRNIPEDTRITLPPQTGNNNLKQ